MYYFFSFYGKREKKWADRDRTIILSSSYWTHWVREMGAMKKAQMAELEVLRESRKLEILVKVFGENGLESTNLS